jgi:amino acid transporter
MAQESVAQTTEADTQSGEHASKSNMLGPLLCWAVVFADIGTSVYYVPGILYGTVKGLAGFFVLLTMTVFVLLTFKYAEVTHRFPQGGGVVTVAAQAINPWFGALGGMFILVDYFLTAAISCLSGMQYLSVVLPAISPSVLYLTIGILVLLGILNWVGISESARVSLVGAVIAFVSDIAILVTVFSHVSLSELLTLFSHTLSNHSLTAFSLLTGFANAFLAFSGLESISQLSPVMKHPHKKVAGMALFLVVITIGITSPLLTLFSTTLLTQQAEDPAQNAQLISLLAGHWGNLFLQTEVAISASALLVFASNTAIIGAYHVFMALSRMEFLPDFILRRNKLRGTPHYSIALATGIPIVILIVVAGNITILGDMYAFGLLGAFSLTCLGLDIVRTREWRRAGRIARARAQRQAEIATQAEDTPQLQQPTSAHDLQISTTQAPEALNGTTAAVDGARPVGKPTSTEAQVRGLWFRIDYVLGILTTLLVATAWFTNLFTKHLATEFGGAVTLLGMIVAYVNYRASQKRGVVPVPLVVTRIDERIPNSVLAILTPNNPNNNAVIRGAINDAEQNAPVVFLYLTEHKPRMAAPQMMEIVDPYLEDQDAKNNFGKAEALAQRSKIPTRKYVYLQGGVETATQVWQLLHPHDTIVPAKENQEFKDINPDRVRYELTPDGKVAHLLKRW